MTDAKTVQLRRYRIQDGGIPDFVATFHSHLIPTRAHFGFTVEFAYLVEESSEFVWAVSHPGDADAFLAAHEAYYASPVRAEMMKDVPALAEAVHVDLVTEVVPAHHD